ncbi:DUF1444 domain-containing protein [Tuberibacillus calidus]|uniref:DUF1444 domain-containing protein n=1 Tax=Tuberibacillus calidus TaxID=340097 RepID=UPI0004114012|nr:DUF1444 domain-containing protein [Tuberibacillus calidus]
MKIQDLLELLKERLDKPEWLFQFHKKDESLRIEDKNSGQGVTIDLNGLLAKYAQRKEQAIDETIYYIKNTLNAMAQEPVIKGNEEAIYPVMRSASFPVETKDGKTLIYNDHTAESRVFYALDLGRTYRLIDRALLEREGLTQGALHEMALFNLRSLPVDYKSDQVAGNTFYFINYNDGYDASRILNQALIDKMARIAEGKLAVAIPHQDVLIFADIKNNSGYDVLGQMTMSFYMNGKVPITPLSFLWENKRLQPIFILAKKKP